MYSFSRGLNFADAKIQIFRGDLISQTTKFWIFRGDLISRTAKIYIFRGDLISRLAKYWENSQAKEKYILNMNIILGTFVDIQSQDTDRNHQERLVRKRKWPKTMQFSCVCFILAAKFCENVPRLDPKYRADLYTQVNYYQ